MNKKQAVIIVTLLVLIVCAGVLATKINNPLGNGDNIIANGSNLSKSQDGKKSSNDYFTEARLLREETNNSAIETLKALIDNKNVSEESRKNAAQQSTKIATVSISETKIETALKGKGYEDVICCIDDDNKARIVVKSKDALNDQQTRDIKNVALTIGKVKNIEIEVRQ